MKKEEARRDGRGCGLQKGGFRVRARGWLLFLSTSYCWSRDLD